MKKLCKSLFLLLLLLATVMIFMCFFSNETGKLLSSAGLFLVLAGIAQLEVSDFFNKYHDKYRDDEPHLFSPPSRITREIIDNPDNPLRTAIRNHLFFDSQTSLHCIVTGTVLQLLGIWL